MSATIRPLVLACVLLFMGAVGHTQDPSPPQPQSQPTVSMDALVMAGATLIAALIAGRRK